ncbi:hypothetical protein C1645_870788 [Glomus cerebriforme]|uniref:FAR1 domain-containing protein n=1 Tax=Glomus cerebriforme TaxID=658196 RepID=A0A397TLT9_9GLOM|nr:hypothetical protein C1645_870788 [Glomus cerebriforme]
MDEGESESMADHANCNDTHEIILSNKDEHSLLYSGKKFKLWEDCEIFINKWAKLQGFQIIRDRVTHEGDIICHRTYICSYDRSYKSTFTKDTTTKKTGCPFIINASYQKSKNPDQLVSINKIIDEHNHLLNISMIESEGFMKFTFLMIEDIKFMTESCKFGATAQRKFLEGKYPTHPVYLRELYKAIQKFWPTRESLLNDAAQISNWLDSQKELDSRWVVFRGWDEDNTLTHLLWMTLSQVENWV